MSVPTSVPFAQLLCRLYAAGTVKPGTTFTYLAPASHRARANGDGPDDFGIGEASGSSPQLSDVLAAGDVPAAAPSPPVPGFPYPAGSPASPAANRSR